MEEKPSEVRCTTLLGDVDVASLSLTKALPVLNVPVAIWGYAVFGTSERKALALEEQLLTGMALYWWVVFVLWVTRRGWE